MIINIGNGIGLEGTKAIADALRISNTLQFLIFSCTFFFSCSLFSQKNEINKLTKFKINS
mgnify:CR=1 FL=1